MGNINDHQSTQMHGPEATQKTKVLMIGCGQMGGALLSSWQSNPAFEFTVVSPSGSRSFDSLIRQVRGPEQLQGEQFDLLIVATKPQIISDVIGKYLGNISQTGLFVSIAAGFCCSSLAKITGDYPIVRIMPNLPVSIGKGVSGLYANDDLDAEHRLLIENLMSTTGHVTWVDSEDKLDRITAIAGSGPGYGFEIARCWTEAGKLLGFTSDEARALVLRTLEGTVQMALSSDRPLDELRNQVTSKNGTTDAGLKAMNGEHQLQFLIGKGINAAYDRAQELR